ncbi:MAG: hypothetical protein BWY04_00292 [candidate division CPR1 bacterium ADurb.Bin160]|uniref:Uncharacterized protein n=1 Tax=candidate division CPR1 bacterium ADurb.Bin160 TaxID=1852826 RepID=A0A1V5ZQD0_9BACT|nr:MAG: hypothetical protein BWY04_00292 [candidate division CPR1 bacterium ADurb.Bin160]
MFNIIPQESFEICFNKTKTSSPGSYILFGICQSGSKTTAAHSISNITLSACTLITFAFRSSPSLF